MKTIATILLMTGFVLNAQSQEEFVFNYPSANRIFISWSTDLQDDEFVGVFKLLKNKKTRGNHEVISDDEVLIYKSKPIHSGLEIKKTLGERYGYVAGLLNVNYPEEIPYKMKQFKHLELLICTMIPEMAVIQGKGYIDNLVKDGNTYDYRVVKMKRKGKKPNVLAELSHFTVEAEDIPVLPPIFYAIQGGNSQIDLYFSNDTTPIAGIDVFRAEDKNGPYTQVNKTKVYIPNNETGLPSYTDESVIPGKTYWYTLKAADIFGNPSIDSDTLYSKSYGCDIEKLPEMEKISFDGKAYNLSWKHPYNSNIAKYCVYISDNYEAIGNINDTVEPNPDSYYSIPIKIDNKDYRYYTISAVSKNGGCEVYSLKQIYRPAKY